MRMSTALNGSSVIQCFEYNNAIEIHDGIIFDFYMGLPHIRSLANKTFVPGFKMLIDKLDICKFNSASFVRTYCKDG